MVTRKAVLSTLIITVLYVVLTILFMNGELVSQTILGNYPLEYKYNLLIALITGVSSAMSLLGLFLLFITAFLTATNITLIFSRLYQLKSSGKLNLVVGGSSLIGIVGSGCATCGLPILSFMGLAGSIGFLPFHGTELSLLAIVLLSISLYLITKKYKNNFCDIKVSKIS